MAVKLAFNEFPQQVDGNGDPLNGAQLFTYVAGSSTKQTTYQDSAGNTANSNPIEFDSSGRPPYPIWVTTGVSYKFVLAPADDTDPPQSPIWTLDNITGINDTSAAQDQWVTGPAPTYVSATSFTLVGDQTSTFQPGRRLKTTNSGGTVYSTIKTSAFTTSTTVTVVNDSGTLDAGLSAVSYGLLSATNPSTPLLSDAYPIVSGSSDKTKKVRIEADGLTTDTTRVITMPDKDVTLADATDSAGGLIELATLAEVQAGTDAARAVTPSTLANGKRVINTPVATTSGTSVTLTTSVPSWATKITLIFNAVSTNGTGNYLVQIGPSGGAESTGYVSESLVVTTASANVSSSTAGFILHTNSASASTSGKLQIEYTGTASTWECSGGARVLTTQCSTSYGIKTITGTMTTIVLTTVGGTNTFDAGAVTVIWE